MTLPDTFFTCLPAVILPAPGLHPPCPNRHIRPVPSRHLSWSGRHPSCPGRRPSCPGVIPSEARDLLASGRSSVPVRGQVLPGRIAGHDQRDLLLAAPALELLFTSDGRIRVGSGIFAVDKSGDPVALRVAGHEMPAMFVNAARQVAGDSDVTRARAACENVDVECLHGLWRSAKADPS